MNINYHLYQKDINLQPLFKETEIDKILDQLDCKLVELAPANHMIRETSTYLLSSKACLQLAIESSPPSLHICFTGNLGRAKPTIAFKNAALLRQLEFVRQGQSN